MKKVSFLLMFPVFISGQIKTREIISIQQKIDSLERTKEILKTELETANLNWIQDQIKKVGVPISGNKEEVIDHLAFSLSYNEYHEQANWVMHIILPAISGGNATRSNDFREDTLVATGTSLEQDYFLKEKKLDGKYKYDGFGYDRGHLAPSADFRWSKKALSESYFYSNMSPQIGDFNRFKWAELENWMREYVTSYNTNLVIVTAPILSNDLAKIERGINKVSIPKYFVKVALDIENNRGIGFILPHKKIERPLEYFAVSIDSVESTMGYDLFSNLNDSLENRIEAETPYLEWLPKSQKDDIMPIPVINLPKGALNTKLVNRFINDGRKYTVCGNVVSTKKHKKGHVFINLDKKFPNQVFSISIFESDIKNFDYEPENYLINKQVCFKGEIGEYSNTPNMVLNHSKQVKLLEEY